MQQARKHLELITPAQIAELGSYANPPQAIANLLYVSCIFFQGKPATSWANMIKLVKKKAAFLSKMQESMENSDPALWKIVGLELKKYGMDAEDMD